MLYYNIISNDYYFDIVLVINSLNYRKYNPNYRIIYY